MSYTPLTRCLLTVDAEPDHTIAARILHLATVRGDTPEWFSARRIGHDGLRITLELRSLDPHATSLLAEKIRNLPPVLGVATAWLTARGQIEP